MLRRTAAALVVLAALSGCTGPKSTPPPSESSAPSAASGESGSVSSAAEPVDYVALGDSYTAGPLISTVRSDPSGCARSTNNYPAFLAEWLEVASYRDVSCSGASTADLTRPQELVYAGSSTPPQDRALSEGTDLVTVGLGGNDFDLFARLSGCADGLPTGAPQRCHAARGPLLRDAARVQRRLVAALRDIGRRAPRARVVVVGYPRVLPLSGTCEAIGLSRRQADTARAVERRLEASQRAAARRTGATWVGLRAATRGHDACAGPDAWVTGAEYRSGEPAPLHPRMEGMRAAAAAVLRVLEGREPPADAGASAAPDPDAVVRNPTLR